ncbi:hypothetical protein PENTCL1PPCAC_8092, partial [Pristionchus entomophagus]
QDPADDLVDGMKKMTTFMDLKNDEIRLGMKYLDLPSRLKLRLNKRLDKLQLSLKNKLKSIDLEISSDDYKLTVVETCDGSYSRSSRDFHQLEQGLCRLARNTSVDSFTIELHDTPNEQTALCLDAIFNFNGDYLDIETWSDPTLSYPQVNNSTLLTLAMNFDTAQIGLICSHLTVQDLCTIRKNMLEDNFKMKTIWLGVNRDVAEAVMKECLGVTIEEVHEPIRGRIYRAADESIELYDVFENVHHCEGDFKTVVSFQHIAFRWDKRRERPDNKHKIKLNQLFEY